MLKKLVSIMRNAIRRHIHDPGSAPGGEAMSDPVDREIADHCRAFQALKGVGRQRGCDGCEAGEAECWGHYCATVLAPKHGIRPHWNLRLWGREQRVHNDRAQQLWEIPR